MNVFDRPCAMVVPDMELICEIMLMSEGFQSAQVLGNKSITLYRFCKEMLSNQVRLAKSKAATCPGCACSRTKCILCCRITMTGDCVLSNLSWWLLELSKEQIGLGQKIK